MRNPTWCQLAVLGGLLLLCRCDAVNIGKPGPAPKSKNAGAQAVHGTSMKNSLQNGANSKSIAAQAFHGPSVKDEVIKGAMHLHSRLSDQISDLHAALHEHVREEREAANLTQSAGAHKVAQETTKHAQEQEAARAKKALENEARAKARAAREEALKKESEARALAKKKTAEYRAAQRQSREAQERESQMATEKVQNIPVNQPVEEASAEGQQTGSLAQHEEDSLASTWSTWGATWLSRLLKVTPWSGLWSIAVTQSDSTFTNEQPLKSQMEVAGVKYRKMLAEHVSRKEHKKALGISVSSQTSPWWRDFWYMG